MADDEFAQVYGATGVDTGAKPEIQKTHTIDIDEDDDDALFMQLYGGSMPSEQDDAREGGVGHRDVVLNPPEIPKVLSDALEDHGHSTKRPSADGVEEESDGESDESDEEESEDDLMINLDENATDYEPSQSKFQRSFQPPGLGTGSSSEVTTIPGLGGASTRVAIGGIPRSAIPGLAVSFAAAAQHKAGPQDPRKVGGEPEPQYTSMRIEDAVFPSEWKPGLPIKLPGQTRVSPEEYKEFLSLGHGEIFSIDLDSVIDAPWRLPGTDPSDFFNFEMNMNDWKAYQDRVTKFRLEFTMKGQIQTMDQSQAADSAMWQSAMFANVENDGKDKSLQASMIDARDESYEAFVTSERPERVSWQRFGSPWDHTIVLTGFHLDFGDQKDTHASPIMNNKSKITGARPPFGGPRPPFPPRPPSMGTGPGMQPPSFMGMPPYGGQSRQTPKLGLGMDYEDQGGPQKPGGRGGRGRGRGRWGGRGPGHGEHPQEGRRESRYHDSAPERPGKGMHSRYTERRDRDRYTDSRYDDRRSDRRESRRDDRRDRDRGSSRRDRDSRRDDRRHRSRSPAERRRHR